MVCEVRGSSECSKTERNPGGKLAVVCERELEHIKRQQEATKKRQCPGGVDKTSTTILISPKYERKEITINLCLMCNLMSFSRKKIADVKNWLKGYK